MASSCFITKLLQSALTVVVKSRHLHLPAYKADRNWNSRPRSCGSAFLQQPFLHKCDDPARPALTSTCSWTLTSLASSTRTLPAVNSTLSTAGPRLLEQNQTDHSTPEANCKWRVVAAVAPGCDRHLPCSSVEGVAEAGLLQSSFPESKRLRAVGSRITAFFPSNPPWQSDSRKPGTWQTRLCKDTRLHALKTWLSTVPKLLGPLWPPRVSVL